jgi:hypothetical protein
VELLVNKFSVRQCAYAANCSRSVLADFYYPIRAPPLLKFWLSQNFKRLEESRMGFNYAIEKAKFEREWTQLRVEYEKAGMSNEKINILHDYDWENFKKERIYAIHTQEFREAQYDNGNSQEDKSPLFKKFLSAISRWDNYAASTSTGWIEDITDERLAARLKELSQEDLELLTQFIIQGFTQSDLEQMGYGKQYKISRRISRLKNFLKK